MSRPPSLRSRVAVGAILWTLGLFTLTSLLVMFLLTRHPHSVVVIHRTLGHIGILGVLAIALLLMGLSQISKGLSPLARLRQRLAAIHRGEHARITGAYPSEVQPLVEDLNTLLQQHEEAITRAQFKAGDLAHGLRTPLAVLSEEARTAEAAGQPAIAHAIRQQVDRMRRQMDWHLAHARAAASAATPGARCEIDTVRDGLIRTVSRNYADRGLDIRAVGASGLVARAQQQDMEEILGNLVDNACKWARSTVSIDSRAEDTRVVLTVDDDGPGVPDDQREEVLRRGVRADVSTPGSGFGLAIASDLARLYGGSVSIDRSAQGGTRATVTLPRADA
jgi:signal transduction histidine kinase